MKRMKELVGRELKWIQPRATARDFELKDGEETVAMLEFRSTFGSLAAATTAEGRWSFKRVGFWTPHVTIRPADTETEIALFRNRTWSAGGTLVLPNAEPIRANTNFWQTAFDFIDERDQPLVRYRKVGGMFHLSSLVEITPQGAGLELLPWLVPFGWYLAIKMRDDASGAAAAAAAAG
jgi:hypothetical protein